MCFHSAIGVDSLQGTCSSSLDHYSLMNAFILLDIARDTTWLVLSDRAQPTFSDTLRKDEFMKENGHRSDRHRMTVRMDASGN